MTQHPDEGTLHAYIDGELPRVEAEALEVHVTACAGCAAALAEARGLVAAASRAISALDAAPASARTATSLAAGSAAAPTRSTARPPIFRVPYARAAALLLLVGGTAVVIDRSGTFDREQSSRALSVSAEAPRSEPVLATAPGDGATAEVAAVAAPANARPTSAAGVATDAPAGPRRAERSMAPTTPTPLAERQAVDLAASQKRPVVSSADSSPPPVISAAPPPPPSPAEMSLSEVVVTGAPGQVGRVSRYRTRDGAILTLTEKPLRTAAAEEVATAGQNALRGMPQAAAAPMSAPPVNTYRWASAEKGLSYTLTGSLPIAELEALSRRLAELERLP